MLNPDQLDALKELINVGVGRAAATLNRILHTHVKLRAPIVRLLPADQVLTVLSELGVGPAACVKLPFRGVLVGAASLVFPLTDAAKIVNILTDQDNENTDMDALRVGTLKEVGNVVLNAVMGTIANRLDKQLRYSMPGYREDTVGGLFHLDAGGNAGHLIVARVNFLLEKLLVEGNIVLYMEVGSMDPLIDALNQLINTTND